MNEEKVNIVTDVNINKTKDRKTLAFNIGFTIALILAFTVVQLNGINGNSMNPVIKEKGAVVTLRDKFVKSYNRFDIVGFNYIVKNKHASGLLKRIVGLPGEKVQYIDHKLYINDIEMDNPYTYIDAKATDEYETTVEFVLGENEYFMVGDNICNSGDSRMFGPVNEEHFYGKVLFDVSF